MRVLKTLFAAIFVLFLTLPVGAKTISTNSYSTITHDPQVIKALDLMDGTTAEWAKKALLGSNDSGLPMIIQFRDLSEISPDYANFDALGWKKGKQLYIYVNKKHQNAPPEALASLLSHESVHQDEYCSLEEETYAWTYEADVWTQMVAKNPDVAKIQCPLTERLNTLARLFKDSNYTSGKIRNVVYSNPGYKGLPVHSPGF